MNSLDPPKKRTRQPDVVRANLIGAALQMLARGEAFSIGSVAKAAGTSKSAVQHHFKTREQLVEALADNYREEIVRALETDESSGPPVMRYARLALYSGDAKVADQWRGLLVASVIEKTIATAWNEHAETQRVGDGPSNTRALLVRLAADGLWLSDLLKTYSIGDAERAEIEKLMLELLNGREKS